VYILCSDKPHNVCLCLDSDSAVISIKSDNYSGDMTGNIASDNDDLWLEDAIQEELDQLDDNCLLSDDSDELCSPENHISSVDTKVLDYWLLLVYHYL